MSNIYQTYNDGFIEYGKKVTNRSATGKRVGERIEVEGKLAYSEMSCRETDYQMAAIKSATLDVKIRTQLPPSLLAKNISKLMVIKEGREFDIISANIDREKGEMFFYLQEVGNSAAN